MKITLLNGNPDPDNTAFETYLSDLVQSLSREPHTVNLITLRDLDIRYCIGCFNCWVKTPGECQALDDSAVVCRALIQSDFTLWASPLSMGFLTTLTKKALDKCIPLIHPYPAVVRGEAHHRARYDRYPRLGLLLQKETSTDVEDLRLAADIFSRTALNFKTQLDFALTTEQPVEAVCQAILQPQAAPIRYDDHPLPRPGTHISAPMHLTVFNGSPRGEKGNTPLLLEQFLNGFSSQPGRSFQVYHLNHLKQASVFQQAYSDASCVLVGFPLYTDAMPGIVKAFIESLEPFMGRAGNPPMGFMVQSGFPESVHSRHVEAYLEKLAARLSAPYLGTLVKGGAEGTRQMPDSMNQKLFGLLFDLGKNFGETGEFNPGLLKSLAQPEKYPSYLGPLFRLLMLTPLVTSNWDQELKQNGAYEKRFAKPYAL